LKIWQKGMCVLIAHDRLYLYNPVIVETQYW
jgi:hypothetical protein